MIVGFLFIMFVFTVQDGLEVIVKNGSHVRNDWLVGSKKHTQKTTYQQIKNNPKLSHKCTVTLKATQYCVRLEKKLFFLQFFRSFFLQKFNGKTRDDTKREASNAHTYYFFLHSDKPIFISLVLENGSSKIQYFFLSIL